METPAHEHLLIVRDDFTRTDNGIRQIERQCVCGLSERRQYDPAGAVVAIVYRYLPAGAGWVPAAEFLKLVFPVRLCGACGGGDVGCETCAGLFVVEGDGSPLGPPPKETRRFTR